MPEKAIEAHQLVYSYGERVAVDGISFDVAANEILGFLGPNGAGKSTVVKMLTGQIPPKSGRALVLGVDVASEPKKVQARSGICFEMTNLYEDMSAVDNLNLFAQLFGVRHFDANSLLERVGLGGRGRELVSHYSKGMKQRLMVARALVNKPEVLFLDEPTHGLDPVSSEAIRSIILEERARGATVFLTTHDMHEADMLSDRVGFINDGRILAMDTPHALKQRYGKRSIKAEVAAPDGTLENYEVPLDAPDTPKKMAELFSTRKVVTLHSEEASLEQIFIHITGRRLA